MLIVEHIKAALERRAQARKAMETAREDFYNHPDTEAVYSYRSSMEPVVLPVYVPGNDSAESHRLADEFAKARENLIEVRENNKITDIIGLHIGPFIPLV